MACCSKFNWTERALLLTVFIYTIGTLTLVDDKSWEETYEFGLLKVIDRLSIHEYFFLISIRCSLVFGEPDTPALYYCAIITLILPFVQQRAECYWYMSEKDNSGIISQTVFVFGPLLLLLWDYKKYTSSTARPTTTADGDKASTSLKLNSSKESPSLIIAGESLVSPTSPAASCYTFSLSHLHRTKLLVFFCSLVYMFIIVVVFFEPIVLTVSDGWGDFEAPRYLTRNKVCRSWAFSLLTALVIRFCWAFSKPSRKLDRCVVLTFVLPLIHYYLLECLMYREVQFDHSTWLQLVLFNVPALIIAKEME